MTRTLATMALVPVLAACSLNAAGNGQNSGATPNADDGSDDEASAGTTEAGGATMGEGEGTGTSGATTLPPSDDTADGPAMDEGPSPHPQVTISHGPAYDFGARNITQNVDQAFTVANEGDADATAVQVTGVSGAFSVTGHDCPETLAPADTCQVQVRFDPDLFGDVQTELQITYQDLGRATSVALPMTGRGVGVTGNLLVNGGGEEGEPDDSPPMGWSIAFGPNWSASWNVAPPHEGSRTISAGWGPPEFDQFTLHQQIDVAALTTWGDASGVRVYYRVFHRSETAGNDPTWVVLRFRDNGGAELESHSSSTFEGTTWNESVGSWVAPESTRHVQLLLECNRVANDWCSGFFDGMEVWAEWLG